MNEILAELMRAQQKFPGKNVTFAALVEEVGELATATFEEPRANVRKEAIQVAVMAMRMILDGDHTYEPWRRQSGLDTLSGEPEGKPTANICDLETCGIDIEADATPERHRITPEMVEDEIADEVFHTFVQNGSTICCLVLNNGFCVTASAHPVNIHDFDLSKGQSVAATKAREKVFELMAFKQKDNEYSEALRKRAVQKYVKLNNDAMTDELIKAALKGDLL